MPFMAFFNRAPKQFIPLDIKIRSRFFALASVFSV
nr:MAG TPA: hypothetical protein [Caudoviricetes sp.]